MNQKQFSLADVLSVVTDTMFSDSFSSIQDMCSFLIGQTIHATQIQRAIREYCRPAILAQYPVFSTINVAGVFREQLPGWMEEQKQKFGAYIMLTALPAESINFSLPISEVQKQGMIPLGNEQAN